MGRTWNPKLSVGIPAIDAQHKELFERADGLVDAMRGGKGAEEVKKLIAYLEQYVSTHFGAEERLLQAKKYPAFAQHKALHETFNREFKACKEQIEKGGSSAGLLKLNSLIGTWLVQHIGQEDTKYAAFLGGAKAQITL